MKEIKKKKNFQYLIKINFLFIVNSTLTEGTFKYDVYANDAQNQLS